MASLSLGNRFHSKFNRIQVDNVNLSGKISDFRQKVSKEIDAPLGEIELIYSGRCLQDEESLESYSITAGVTVHVMKKVGTGAPPPEPEPLDGAAIQQLTTALQDAFLNAPTSRSVSVINRMLTAPETLENIVAATPGLENDPVALAILQTPQFVAYLADPSTVQKILKAHPSVGQAAMMIAAALNEEAAKGGMNASGEDNPSNPGVYSLDQMSDDEDFDGTPPSHRRQHAGQAITTSQLAAALAAATRGSPTSGSRPGGSQQSQGPPVITGDFFRQAMMQAMGNSTAGPSVPSGGNTANAQQQQQQLQSQIQQLREMGITDDAAALQALQASGGDLQMALSILFGDNM